MVHTAVAGADGSEVLRVALGAGAAPALTVSTPLPLFLPDGIRLAVGAAPGAAAAVADLRQGRLRGGARRSIRS